MLSRFLNKLDMCLGRCSVYVLTCRVFFRGFLQGMTPEVRGLFDQVETVARFLLVVPVSSAESERSFSSLRRLKTWLHSTMTQIHLNSVAVCHVHKDKLDRVNRKKDC